eukprot:TRINITY_DN4245_c0_g1_i2.p1 TRINITY_DN4245_c0_g1~~TRINITY_DN4245_c0_g1_i2.p1  ORF type:complete len:497 (+),score=40.89 TRINITY_DN4245_c0_g1_i2:142-1632(+)
MAEPVEVVTSSGSSWLCGARRTKRLRSKSRQTTASSASVVRLVSHAAPSPPQSARKPRKSIHTLGFTRSSNEFELDVTPDELNLVRTYSATIIQSRWRGYLVRRQLSKQSLAIPHQPANAGFAMRRKSAIQRESMPKARFASGRVLTLYDVAKTYIIDDTVLGAGQFAEVRLAKDKRSGTEVAVKMIEKATVMYPPEKDLLFNEIRIMQKLDHQHCVCLLDMMETTKHVLLFLEYMSEGDLFDCLSQDGPFTEQDASLIIRDTLSGLAHLHSQRIVHRDLKPENIMFSRNARGIPTVKLTDFGLACIIDEPLRAVVGSPSYMAPEVALEQEPGYGLPVDLWSVGIVTYVALSGQTPYEPPAQMTGLDPGFFSTLAFFHSESWNDVSAHAKDFIEQLLQVRPMSRLRARQALRHPWVFRRDAASTTDRRRYTQAVVQTTRRASIQFTPPKINLLQESGSRHGSADLSTSLLSELNTMESQFGPLIEVDETDDEEYNF